MEWIYKFDGETGRKPPTWKAEKEVRGIPLRSIIQIELRRADVDTSGSELCLLKAFGLAVLNL
jgi:hypothetical protein